MLIDTETQPLQSDMKILMGFWSVLMDFLACCLKIVHINLTPLEGKPNSPAKYALNFSILLFLTSRSDD